MKVLGEGLVLEKYLLKAQQIEFRVTQLNGDGGMSSVHYFYNIFLTKLKLLLEHNRSVLRKKFEQYSQKYLHGCASKVLL